MQEQTYLIIAFRMRRVDGTKAFKPGFGLRRIRRGVEAFLNADPKPVWDDKELLIMSKEAYVEMKIKEKGLKGKAAISRLEPFRRPYRFTDEGFDTFREMAEGKDPKSGKKGAGKAKLEIFVEFLGAKLRVLDEDGGSVAAEDVPRVRGSALRFVGRAGEVSFDEIKRPLKERFSRAPFVRFTKGDDAGLVGFDKALDEDDIAFVKEKIPTLNGNPITWELPEEEDEHAFGIERANSAAKRALGGTESTRGGRGAGRARGGRGGRGGGRDRGARRNKGGDGDNRPQNGGDEQAGEKRKSGMEPDGGDNAGVRGQVVPTIVSASTSKKPKTDGGES
ncbi:hypothetical protein V8E53_005621 [Lactarius tabidus]